jgi:DNA-binding MarR family transcriptional regulator
VLREPHPADRRATLVRLTERGLEAAAEWRRGYQDLANLLFADLGAAEFARFAAVLDRLLGRIRAGSSASSSTSGGLH